MKVLKRKNDGHSGPRVKKPRFTAQNPIARLDSPSEDEDSVEIFGDDGSYPRKPHSLNDNVSNDDSDLASLSPPSKVGASADPLRTELETLPFEALASAQEDYASQITSSSPSTSRPRVQALKEQLSQVRALRARASHSQPVPTFKSRAATHSRSSKHAPTSQSSAKPVSRSREVLTDPQARWLDSHRGKNAGDPRFNPLAGPLNERTVEKRYAFISDYRKTELQDLQQDTAEIKRRAAKRRSGQMSAEEEGRVAELRREMDSLKGKQRADERRDREREVVRRHRKEEREKVRSGQKSKAFFLKKKDIRERVKEEGRKEMNSRERRKADERKVKREAKKERKGLAAVGSRRRGDVM